MKEFLEFILKHLVDHPDQVSVNEIVAERVLIYEVKVTKPDVGKILGKHGRHANAIRILLNAIGKKSGKHIQLEILEPDS